MTGLRGPASRHRSRAARRTASAVLLAVGVLAASACGSDDDSSASTSTSPTAEASATPTLTGEVTVLAAASLTEAFTTIAADLEAANPGLTVRLSFGASSALAEQIVAGAPADVFAAASPATMATVTDAGLAEGEPQVFVRNVLQIAVPAGNPAGVTGLADFARDDLRLAVCDTKVPCGAAATKVFEASGTAAKPDTLESDVKATLAKVQLGEVDAALVYATDVQAAGADVEGIEFPEAQDAVNDYPIVALAAAPNPEGAAAFVAAVTSASGVDVLGEAGFLPP